MMDEWTKNRRRQPAHSVPRRDHEGRARKYDRESRWKKALDERLDKGLEESFPASDPVAVIQPPQSPYDRYMP